jgi:3-hydroxyacyl-[acyl-carrier-protein] dehydratase
MWVNLVNNTEKSFVMDIKDILRHQKNRYPVLFIDKVVDLVPGKRAVGIKCFTFNEWFFQGHFADDPNVPGTIQIECMAQTLLLSFQCIPEYCGLKANASTYRKVNFRRRIVPGDTLRTEAVLQSFKRGIAIGNVLGFVGDEEACSAEFVIVLPDVLNKYSPAKN